MHRIRAGRTAAIVVSLVVVGLLYAINAGYQRDLRQARERIAAGSRIAGTACGPIEYALAGDGPPVLVVHGSGGGFDQGIDVLEPLAANGFRIIVGVEDDLFGTYDGARYSAEHIPNARLVGYPSGGHLWVGHHAEVMREITAFLWTHRGGE